MLIDPQGNKLGDTNLDFAESLAQKKEETKRIVAAYALPDEDKLTNQEANRGNGLEARELIHRITNIAPQVVIAQGGVPGNVALYVDRDGKPHYVGGFPATGFIPEHSSIRVDENNLVITDHTRAEIRGWRNVIVRLLEEGVLNWEQAISISGDVENDHAVRWKKLTQGFRTL